MTSCLCTVHRCEMVARDDAVFLLEVARGWRDTAILLRRVAQAACRASTEAERQRLRAAIVRLLPESVPDRLPAQPSAHLLQTEIDQ